MGIRYMKNRLTDWEDKIVQSYEQLTTTGSLCIPTIVYITADFKAERQDVYMLSCHNEDDGFICPDFMK